MNTKIKTCIVCPKGCQLVIKEVDGENQKIEVEDNGCKRGIDFAQEEMYNPKRTVQTTVKTVFKDYERVSVKTSVSIPKDRMFDVMKIAKATTVDFPINVGDVVAENILGLGVDLVATAGIKSDR